MTILIGLRRQKAGQGFTLIELLLATVLLMLLLSAMVFSYSALQRGVALDEGATQFEALLRYVQSQASTTGRKVQLVFEEPIAEDISMSFGQVRVMWEPDPLGQPGQWVELPSAADFVRRMLELVQVQAVHPFDPGQPAPPPIANAKEVKGAVSEKTENSDYQPPIVFYPDGSSDSAEITLAALDSEDTRRITVRLVGITGSIQRRLVVDESESTGEETDQREPRKDVPNTTRPPVEFPSSTPVSTEPK